jgi:hypothetical protein
MLAASPFNQLRYALFMLGNAVIVGMLLGAAIVFSSPTIVILALAVVLSVILVLKNPAWGIVGFIALTATVLDSDVNPGISLGFGHIYLSDIIILTLFWLIGWELFTRLEAKFVRTPLDIPLLVFVAVAFVSTIIAMIRGTATLKLALGPTRDVLSLLLFFAVTNLVKTDKQVKLLQGTIIVFACFVSIVMAAQYITGAALPFLPGRVEVLNTEGTTFSDITRIIPPGYSIVFVAFVVTCTIWFFNNKYLNNFALAIAISLTGIGVLLTFKRHFWGALIFIFLIMVLVSNGKEIQRILLRGFSAFAIMLVGLFFVMNYTGPAGTDLVASSADRMFSLTRTDTYDDPNSSLRWRDFENQYALRQFVSHPFIGVGLGTMYRPWVPDKDWSGYDGRRYIHSGFYWLLLRTGGIGFLSMLAMMTAVVVRGFKYWRVVPNGVYVLGFTLAIVGMLMGNWVEPLISEWYWTGVTATLMGLNELSIRSISSPNA